MTLVNEDADDERTALRRDPEALASGELDLGSPVTTDPSAVEFKSGKGSDVLIVGQGRQGRPKPEDDEEFICLRKEELQKYASDPYWVRLRVVLLVICALAWLAMLVAAVVIIVVAPKCPPRPDQEWWETAVFYQLNPNSFLDTVGDGRGDLKGIAKKLDYLKELKVTALNLGPFYPSPWEDFGYDVSDFKSICGHYGKMDDFAALLLSLHKQGIKLILDFIPNHTSRKHRWFVQSRNSSDASNRFKDFYIWQHGKNGSNGTLLPPNNWLNVYGESAWTLDEARGEFFYHSYSSKEPDLNLNNSEVIQLLDEALNFWLEKEVDGFRIIGAEHLFEPKDMNGDNSKIQPETYELIGHWRELLNNFSFSEKLRKSRRFSRLMIVDTNRAANESVEFFEHNGRPGAHLSTNKVLLSLTKNCSAKCVFSLVNGWSEVIGRIPKIANWQVGDSNTSRIVTRMGGKEYLNAINLLLLTLPGTTLVYNGDELGMKDVVAKASVNYSFPQGLISRIGQHSPMQWSDKPNAGFTSGTPWIPTADDYSETNVEAETAHGSGSSHIKVFESVTTLKQEPSIQWGKFNVALNKSIVLFVRQAEGFAGFLVAVNFGPHASTVVFRESSLKDLLPEKGEIVATTRNFGDTGRHENYREGTTINLGAAVYLKPAEGIVLKWEPEASFL